MPPIRSNKSKKSAFDFPTGTRNASFRVVGNKTKYTEILQLADLVKAAASETQHYFSSLIQQHGVSQYDAGTAAVNYIQTTYPQIPNCYVGATVNKLSASKVDERKLTKFDAPLILSSTSVKLKHEPEHRWSWWLRVPLRAEQVPSTNGKKTVSKIHYKNFALAGKKPALLLAAEDVVAIGQAEFVYRPHKGKTTLFCNVAYTVKLPALVPGNKILALDQNVKHFGMSASLPVIRPFPNALMPDNPDGLISSPKSKLIQLSSYIAIREALYSAKRQPNGPQLLKGNRDYGNAAQDFWRKLVLDLVRKAKAAGFSEILIEDLAGINKNAQSRKKLQAQIKKLLKALSADIDALDSIPGTKKARKPTKTPAELVAEIADLQKQLKKCKGRAFNERVIGRFPFAMFKRMLIAAAAKEGLRVEIRSAKYTSQDCPRCGHRSKSNRPAQTRFVCQQPGCHLVGHADLTSPLVLVKRRLKELRELTGNRPFQTAQFRIVKPVERANRTQWPTGGDQHTRSGAVLSS